MEEPEDEDAGRFRRLPAEAGVVANRCQLLVRATRPLRSERIEGGVVLDQRQLAVRATPAAAHVGEVQMTE
jgi:hypothetical protein